MSAWLCMHFMTALLELLSPKYLLPLTIALTSTDSEAPREEQYSTFSYCMQNYTAPDNESLKSVKSVH